MRAVYIHIPFCNSICSYCDFCKTYYYSKWAYEYLKKLKEEIEDAYLGDEIKSIYIGGGTPSILKSQELLYLFDILNIFKKKEDFEFTFECNLNDITEELLSILKEAGVNRLSIGVESFQDHILKFLGREHTFVTAKEKMALIRSYGFQNVNLDLIYAVPGETLKDLKEDLKLFLKLKPDHISTYSLQIEPHTILDLKRVKPIEEELDASMYELIYKTLERKHFIHYEVSNFALEKKESLHNLTYWDNEEYYGFGVSASGYIDQIRYTNTKSLTAYLKGNWNAKREILGKKDIMDNEIMLGLRKRLGIHRGLFEKKYKVPLEEAYPIVPLLKNGDLKEKKGFVYIPIEKVYVMNEILMKMI